MKNLKRLTQEEKTNLEAKKVTVSRNSALTGRIETYINIGSHARTYIVRGSLIDALKKVAKNSFTWASFIEGSNGY